MKTKIFFSAVLIFLITTSGFAQKVYTKNGNINFFSKSPLENITAENNQVMSVLNQENGEMQFSVIIKSFQFKKALMEEHFNENYLESNKYPKATFKGTISDISKVNFKKDGSYSVVASGDLTIHGKTNKVSAPGSINIKGGIPTAGSKFMVKLADYDISIPKVVKDNIAEQIEINVVCTFDKSM